MTRPRRLSDRCHAVIMAGAIHAQGLSMTAPTQAVPADAQAPVETLYQGRWLSLRKRGRWEYAERNNPGGAVIILAVTPEDKLLFVEQYRVAIQKHTIEMPAGLVGDL